MIKKLLVLAMLFLTVNVGFGQCPTGFYILTTQAEVDAFALDYPSCSNSTASIRIIGEGITDLSALSQIERVSFPGGISVVDCPSLTSLAGLNNIRFTGGTLLRFEGSNVITSIANVISPLSTGFYLEFIGNPQVTSLVGFPAITSIRGVTIENTALTNLTGLEGVQIINGLGGGGSIDIIGNENLVSLNGLQDITFQGNIQNRLFVRNNPLLESLDGLLFNSTGPKLLVWIDNNDSLANFNGFGTIPELGELQINRNDNLLSLEGLEAVTSVGSLKINENPLLVNLQGLNNLTESSSIFQIMNNANLQSVEGLQNVQVSFTPGSTFGGVVVSGNPMLESIEGLIAPGSGAINLVIVDNPLLTDLVGLEGFDNVGNSINVSSNANLENIEALINFTGLPKDLRIIDNASLANLNGLQNITTSNTTEQNVRYEITENPSLNDISGLVNFDLLNLNSTSVFWLENNTALSQCAISNICEVLDLGTDGNISIDSNGSLCVTEGAVAFACGLDVNIVEGLVQFDVDNDGCDIDDIVIPSVMVQTTDGTNFFASFTDANGVFETIVDFEGLATTSIVPGTLPVDFNIAPATVENTFVGFQNIGQADFCVDAEGAVDNLEITAVALNQAVPGFDGAYRVIYENRGNIIQDAEVTFEFDPALQSFINSVPAPISVVDGLATWNFTSIGLFEQGFIDIELNNFAPPINQINDDLTLVAFVEDEGDESPVNNRSTLEQIFVGSYDPNDIQVTQGPEIFESEVDNYLDYIVRFQNTGTGNAITVRVDHVLSDELDWNTLRPISSSHEYLARVFNGNEVSFIFNDINLPPQEQDEAGSNGFIVFQIKPKEGFGLGDSVDADASIFFDFNEPIFTNTVTTTVVENLGLEDNNLENTVILYPNPVSDLLTIKVTNGVGVKNIIINSIEGKELFSTSEMELDFSNMSDGIYFVTIETISGIITKKIVKQ